MWVDEYVVRLLERVWPWIGPRIGRMYVWSNSSHLHGAYP